MQYVSKLLGGQDLMMTLHDTLAASCSEDLIVNREYKQRFRMYISVAACSKGGLMVVGWFYSGRLRYTAVQIGLQIPAIQVSFDFLGIKNLSYGRQ